MQTKIEVAENANTTLVTITVGDREYHLESDDDAWRARGPGAAEFESDDPDVEAAFNAQRQEERIEELVRELREANHARDVAIHRANDLEMTVDLVRAEANEAKATATDLRRLKDEALLTISDLYTELTARNVELGVANRKVDEYVAWQRRRAEGYQQQNQLGSRYVFHEIPVEELDAFKAVIAPYFNGERYNVRIRGQHLKQDVEGRQWKMAAGTYAVKDCTHARVYIDEKLPVY